MLHSSYAKVSKTCTRWTSDTLLLGRIKKLQITVRNNQDIPTQGTNNSGVLDDSYCSYHRVCGANGNCDLTKAPACVCLDGFTPKSPSGWDSLDYSQGCEREKALNCSTTNVFFKYGVFQEPSGTYSLLNQSLAEEDCRAKCLSNCSCVAYTIRNGCKLWTGDLFDVRVINGGQDLYIRMPAASELDPELMRGKSWASGGKDSGSIIGSTGLYFWMVFVAATAQEKGTLQDGREEIAVKRLSSSSGQGLNELKNESNTDSQTSASEMEPKISDFGLARSFVGEIIAKEIQ
ncbi:S-locus glycoprotein domain [Sesbania bispinosa]|nr:S-locus glycoprotein domain [Sesbania bispinosa]